MQHTMTRNWDSKLWANHSQKTTKNVTISLFDQRNRQSKAVPVTRIVPVPIQRTNGNNNPRVSHRHCEEYFISDKQRDAQTGRWVLNVITAHETYQKAMRMQKNHTQTTIVPLTNV